MITVPRKFQPWFTEAGLKPSPFKYAYGGRAGGKSYFYADMAIIKCLAGRHKILCVRQFATSLNESVYPLIQERAMEHFPEEFRFYRDRIECPRTGSVITFAGLDRNIGGVKSTQGITVCWVEEGSYIKAAGWDILVPTVHRNEGAEIWISLNPDCEDDPLLSEFVDPETMEPLNRDDTLYCKINYYDNPFLTGYISDLAEKMRERDYDKYFHIYEGGLNRISEAQVFCGKWAVAKFEAPDDAVFYHGLDFGFSVDPNAWVRCYILNDCLYIDHAVYTYNSDYEDLARVMPGKLPTCERWKTYADSARPEGINYLRKRNFNAWSVGGKTSVEAGVEYLRSFKKIYIHERCKELIHEAQNYKYKIDSRTGDVTPVFVDKYNHGWDAVRYALHPLILRGA